MKNLNPLYLQEGRVGDSLKIIKSYQRYINPNKGNSMLFAQNERLLRNKFANRLLTSGPSRSPTRKGEYNRVTRYLQDRINKYRNRYGELPEDILINTFERH